MSISTEITRITTARNTIRTKAVSLGIGLATDDIGDLATKIDGIVDRGTPDAEVQEGQTYTIQPGYYHGGTVEGVAGGGSYTLQAKTVTPTKSQQVVSADSGYYGISTATVNPIPDTYQDVTSVTATASDVLANKTIVNAIGTVIAGTMANNGAISRTLDTETTSTTIPIGYHNGSGTVSITLETKSATPTTASQDIEPTSGKVLSKVTVNPIPSNYGDATGKTVTASDVLSGKTAIGYDTETASAISVTGTMTNNGAVTQALDAETTSYTIPSGYHNGNGTVSIILETKSATPTTSAQDIEPTSGKVLSKVTVNAIPSNYGDATGKTVTASDVLSGKTAIGYDSETSSAVTVTGTMTNNGAVALTMDGTTTSSVTIPAGYHNGSGTVSLDSTIETALASI